MKKILLVGYDYNYRTDINKQYKDYLFIPASNIEYNSAERLIAMVGMVDGILIIGNDEYMNIKAVAILLGKNIYFTNDFPVNEEKEKEA